MVNTNGGNADVDAKIFDDDDALDEESFDPEEYDVMVRLERLESLEEEMAELGVVTLAEVRARIAQLHQQLDAS